MTDGSGRSNSTSDRVAEFLKVLEQMAAGDTQQAADHLRTAR